MIKIKINLSVCDQNLKLYIIIRSLYCSANLKNSSDKKEMVWLNEKYILPLIDIVIIVKSEGDIKIIVCGLIVDGATNTRQIKTSSCFANESPTQNYM